jgi:CDP-glycerol glycerophosphotransferase (TagB/SpsB family)
VLSSRDKKKKNMKDEKKNKCICGSFNDAISRSHSILTANERGDYGETREEMRKRKRHDSNWCLLEEKYSLHYAQTYNFFNGGWNVSGDHSISSSTNTCLSLCCRWTIGLTVKVRVGVYSMVRSSGKGPYC